MALTRDKKAQLSISQNKLAGGNLSNAYYKHAVIYGDYIDVRTYKDVKYTFNGFDTSKNRRKKGERSTSSLARAKVTLYRLIVGNIGKHGKYKPLFVTYTFKDNVENLDTALDYLRKYLLALRYQQGKKPLYVCVPQIQWERFEKTGFKVWHFHICFFNLPPLNFKQHDKLWPWGYVNSQHVRGIRSIGAYLAGYFTKEDWRHIPLNKKFYYCSRSLVRPTDLYQHSHIDKYVNSANVKILSKFEGETYTQIKYKLNG